MRRVFQLSTINPLMNMLSETQYTLDTLLQIRRKCKSYLKTNSVLFLKEGSSPANIDLCCSALIKEAHHRMNAVGPNHIVTNQPGKILCFPIDGAKYMSLGVVAHKAKLLAMEQWQSGTSQIKISERKLLASEAMDFEQFVKKDAPTSPVHNMIQMLSACTDYASMLNIAGHDPKISTLCEQLICNFVKRSPPLRSTPHTCQEQVVYGCVITIPVKNMQHAVNLIEALA